MSWLNFNDSLNNLKGQISNLAQSVLAEEEGAVPKEGNYEDLKNICLQQEREIENLRRINEELNHKQPQNANWDWMTGDERDEDPKERIKILKDENADLLHQLEQLDSDNQQNCAKIINLKDKVQGDYDRLQAEHDALKREQAKWDSEMVKMEAELQEYKSKVIVNNDFKEKYHQVLDKCKRLESNNNSTSNHHDQELLQVLEDTFDALKAREDDPETLQAFNEKFHLIKTLTSHSKPESPDFTAELDQKITKALQEAITHHDTTPQTGLPGLDQQLVQLSNTLKSTSVETDRLEHTIKEKNDEIQKLIDSSDILNQELMQKTRIIREYENEMKEFEKNNELLIMELESYKSNALETISESNEDKVILLEEELEMANSRIKDLESEKYDGTTQTEPKSWNQDQYTELLNRYDKLQIDYDFLKKDFESIKEDLKFANEEYLSLKSMAETEEMNTRNFQQHLDTLNAINEKLQAEIQPLKDKIDYLFRENAKLAAINEESYAQIGNLKGELEVYKEKSLLEANQAVIMKDEVATLTEKLKDVKMTETSLKLQCDTLHKEIANLNGIKAGLEGALIEAREELKGVKSNLMNLDIENNKLKVKLESLQETNFEISKQLQILQESNNEVKSESEVDGLCRENYILRDRLEELSNSTDETVNLEKRNLHLTAKNTKLEEEVQRYETLKHSMDTMISDLRNELQTLKGTKQTADDDIVDVSIKNRLQTELATLAPLKQENAILKEELQKLNSALQDQEALITETNKLKSELTLQETNVASPLKQQNASLKEELQRLTSLLRDQEALIAETNKLKSELALQETNVASPLKQENASLKEELQRLTSVLRDQEALIAETNKLKSELALQETNAASLLKEENASLKEELQRLTSLLRDQEALIAETNKLKSELALQETNAASLLKEENASLKEELQRLTSLLRDQEALIAETNKLKSELGLQKTAASSELQTLREELQQTVDKHNQLQISFDQVSKSRDEIYQELSEKHEALIAEMNKLKSDSTLQGTNATTLELQALREELQEALDKHNQLQIAFEQVSTSRDEIYKALTGKHEENVAYHNEIQRLMQIIASETEKCKNLELQLRSNEDIEKIIDENNFLKEKCDVLTQNLLKEQEKVLSEKSKQSEEELALKRKLNKLQEHLLELEERHTQELVQAEQHNAELQAKVNKIEEREKNNSTMYTSVNIRANQQVESLQNLLAAVTGERDSLRKQLSDAEDNINKQTAALTNLQLVLEQFRKDKEKEVFKETERLRRQIKVEKQSQENLKKEISALKSQQEETKQGLLAASRLSDQLEQSKRNLTTLKEEASQLKSQLLKKEDELNTFKTQTSGKVDKTLVKNLVIGFVTTNNNKLDADQKQILKIISTVLDFSKEDHDKLNLNKDPQGSWLNALLGPQTADQNPQESLSKAFVQFLENESRPKVIPSLLNMNPDSKTPSTSRSSSTTPKQNQPGNLSEIVLPTFTDFGQNRNSSSILKDVLKDNS